MAIPSSGALTFSELQNEYGGNNPIGLGEYYAGGSFVAAGTGGNSGAIPSSGALPIGRFYGSAAAGLLWGSRFLRPGLLDYGNVPGPKIRFFNNRFFIVGDRNNPSLTYSSDYTGTSWTTVSLPRFTGPFTFNSNFNSALRDIAWNGTTYVAVGDFLFSQTNTIVTSTDLINWTPRNVDIGTNKSIATNGNLFVVPGGANKILTSPDGITWTTIAISGRVYDIIWNGFTFVAIGEGVFYSTNGVNWSPGNNLSGAYAVSGRGLAWGNNTFVASGGADFVYTSPNGVSWTQRPHAYVGQGGSVAFGSGLFVSLGSSGGTIGTSPDGITWTWKDTAWTNNTSFAGTGVGNPASYRAICYGLDRFIIAGAGSAISSSDGLNWTSLSTGAVPYTIGGPNNIGGTLRAVASNGSVIVAVGDPGRNTFNRTSGKPTVIVSSDGNTWNHVNTNALVTFNEWGLYDVIWTGNRFVAVGGNSFGSGVLIWTSEDGTNWTSRVSNNVDGPLNSVAKKGSRLIALTFGGPDDWVSDDDGINWTKRSGAAQGAGGGKVITSNGSIFVKISDGGPSYGMLRWSSSDGTTWSSQNIPSTLNFYPRRIRWVNNRFIICGVNISSTPNVGFMIYSLDGITWASCSIPEATSNPHVGVTTIYDVSYSFGKYYAVSQRGIFVSTDGINFSLLSGYSISAGSGFMPLVGITNTSNKIISVGASGAVVTSPPPNATTM